MILIIEDNADIRQELAAFLGANGHPAVCLEHYPDSQEEMADAVRGLCTAFLPELILLDISLGACDGLKLCMDIRSRSSVPIIFVTGRTDEKDELAGILTGGDDFICKPYSLPVLLARINRILFRQRNAASETVRAGSVSMNILDGQVSWQGRTLNLPKNEVKILYCLFLNKGTVVTKDSLIEYLWENKYYVDENILNVNLSRLRNRLKELGLKDLIVTVPQKGFTVNDVEQEDFT